MTALHRKSSSGFSIVELMVGITIALLTTIVIFQVFASSEGYKRTTTSGGDAQQNGAIALIALERELRMAGHGINDVSLNVLGCAVQAFDAGNAAATPPIPARGAFNFVLGPVLITQGAPSDSITISYGNAGLQPSPVAIMTNMIAPTNDIQVQAQVGFNLQDLFLAVERPLGVPNCSLGQVSGKPGGGNLAHTGGRYNNPAGVAMNYTSNGKVLNLGPAPVNAIYSVLNGQLQVQSFIAGTAAAPVVDGIINLQAEYGRDTTAAADGIVDVWDTDSPTNPDEWSRVLAVRLAVVARSALPEKPNPDTLQCDTTANAPTWSSTLPDAVIDLSADPNWQCYRYRVYETTVPLRNMIWRPQ